MKVYIIYGIVIFSLILLIFITFVLKSKFRILNYKLNEAEKKIKDYLEEKYETILKIKDLFEKNNLTILPNNIELMKDDINDLHKFDEELKKCDLPIFEIFEYNVNLEFTDEDKYLFSKFKKINIELTGTKKYFNNNVEIINKLKRKKLVKPFSKILKIKSKDNYLVEKEEILETL